MPTRAADLLAAAYSDADRTIDLRRRIHRRPEIGLQLPETQATVLAGLQRVAAGIAAAHEMTAEYEHVEGYPVTVNDAGAAATVVDTAAALLGPRASVPMAVPLMGAEDFSYVLQRVPGAIAFLGACPPGLEPEESPANHSNLVVFDEEPLPAGVALYARMALDALAG